MNPEHMQQAIKKGWVGVEKGQEPFGACLVKDNKILSLAHNTIRSSIDVTAHAEMNAIREACKKLDSTDLSGCEIYATFKPCSMCMEAIKRAGITTVYYGAGPEDVEYRVSETSLSVTGGMLRDQCLALTSKKYNRLEK
jgi:guanine deaminase